MLTILSTILGFAGPFIPAVLKLFQQGIDQKHEIEVMRLQAEIAAKQHTWKLEEISANADVEESRTLRQPQQSFGVQILDAARGHAMPLWAWLPVFWAFGVLDWLRGMVRPAITYVVVAFWLTYKVALYLEIQKVNAPSWSEAVTTLWVPDDWAVLMLCLSYWFGQRAVNRFFPDRKSI